MQEMASFGQYLKAKRKELDLTQEELAQRAQCATETVRKVEAGNRRPSKVIAQALAAALQLEGAERDHFLRLARSEAGTETPKQESSRSLAVPSDGSAPLLATKLYLPRPRTHIVARPRLLARLEAGLRGPLTLIAAPAGFGKTTLLADWLRRPTVAHRPVAWLTLDAGDSDPVQFFRYLISALQTLDPSIGATLLPLLRSAQPPPLQPLLMVLVNDLTRAPEGSLLVLDDYHVVDAPAIHQALTFLLDHLSPQFHLLVASRVDPPLPLSRLRARGELVEIRAADLRFNSEEAAAFLQEVMGLPLSAADVAAVEARTEGWIAGLQLAALSLQELPAAEVSAFIDSFTGSHRFVVDYLVDEVLANQPPHIQAFLLKTSILDRLCGPLCAAIAEIATTASQQLLEQLERANLFMVPLDEERHWYRYHHLFAQVLNERLLSSATQEGVAGLHRRAATWFEQQGAIAEAVKHALAAQDWEASARLIEAHGWLLVVQGQGQLVRSWFKTLPEKLLRGQPYLLDLQAGLLFGANDIEAAERTMQAAEEASLMSGINDPSRPIAAYAALMRANIARARGDIAQCSEHARQALSLLPPSEVIRRSVATLGIALIFRATGDVGPINEELVSSAVVSAQRAGNMLTLFNTMLAMAEFYWMQGRLRQATAAYHKASGVAPHLFALQALTNGASYYCGLGRILYEQNELDAAEQHLLQGQEMIRRGRQTHGDVVTTGYLTLARLQQARGNGEAALVTLRELQTVAHERKFAPYLLARTHAAAAELALQQDDLAGALRWAESNEWRGGDELDYLYEQEWLVWVRVQMAQSRHNGSDTLLTNALHLLDKLLTRAEAHKRMASVLYILILRALLLQEQGNAGAAVATLADALQLASPEGYLRPFVDEGRAMAALLVQAIKAEQLPPALRRYAEMLLDILHQEGVEGITESLVSAPGTPLQLPGGEFLTQREIEVLQLLATGRSNQAIAQELVVEIGTVKRHVSNIMGKLQVQSRLEAVVRARALNLIPAS